MIAQIIISSLALLIGLITIVGFFFYKNKKNNMTKTNDGEILICLTSQSYRLFILIFFLSLVGFIVLLVASILKMVSLSNFVMYAVLLFILQFLSTYSLAGHHFSYLIIKDDLIEEHKVFRKVKSISFSDIDNTSVSQSLILFISKERKVISSFSFLHVNADKAVNYLYNKGISFNKELLKYLKIEVIEKVDSNESNEKVETKVVDEKTEVVEAKKENELDKYTKEQIEAFRIIGEDFRQNVEKYHKKEVVKFVIFQVVLAIAIVLLALFNGLLWLLLLLINLYLIYSKYKELKHKYDINTDSDVKLGIKKAHLNKKVIGYHQAKNRSFKSMAVMICILLVIFTGFSGFSTFSAKPLNYDNTTTITGNLVTCKINESNLVEITLEDVESNYKDYKFILPNALDAFVNKDDIVKEEINQEVTIKVNITDEKATTLTILYLKIGENEHVNQNTLDQYFDKYIDQQKVSFFIMCGVTLLVIGGSFGYYYFNKIQAKKETINISK